MEINWKWLLINWIGQQKILFATEGPSQKFLVMGHPTDFCFWGKIEKSNLTKVYWNLFKQLNRSKKKKFKICCI